MRRILVERARHYQRLRHGGGASQVELEDGMARADPQLVDLVAIHEALSRLEQSNPRKAQVVTLRYFAGLSIEESAAALDLSPATVKNEWKFARAWLYRALGPAGGAMPPDRRARERHSPPPGRRAVPELAMSIRHRDPHSSMARCAGNSHLRTQVEALLADVEVPDESLNPAHLPSLDIDATDGPLRRASGWASSWCCTRSARARWAS